MKKILKKKQLEMEIQNIPNHKCPKVDFEQYSTPSTIASDLVWNAYSLGDIYKKNIIDLGCGTGILTIASALLGAKKTIGYDIDGDAIAISKDYASKKNINNIDFFKYNVLNLTFDENFDTLIQNPPFGSQKKAIKGIDIKFIDKALNIADVIYSFHMASTRDFIFDYFKKNGVNVSHEFIYDFTIPKTYDFHTKSSKDVKVIVFRVENV